MNLGPLPFFSLELIQGRNHFVVRHHLFSILAIVITGCSSPIEGIVNNNNVNLDKLHLGMPKALVLELMGPAGKTEAYDTKQFGAMEILFYKTQVAKVTGKPGEITSALSHAGHFPSIQGGSAIYTSWTPICIINGRLTGWGHNYLNDKIKNLVK